MADAPPSLARRALPWALGLWAVGVQVQEGLATVGAWLTALLAVAVAWPALRSAAWVRSAWGVLAAFIAWSLLAPLLAGHPPTGTGVARTLDWVLVPAAAVAVASLDERRLSNVALAAAVTLLVSVVLAGLQHFGVWPKKEFFDSLAWLRSGFHRVYETVPGRTDRFMAGGFLLHRLKFANVTATLCALGAAAVALRARRWKLFAATTLLGVIGVAVFPYARAASATVVAVVALVWVLAAERRRQAIVGAALFGALMLAVVAYTPSLRHRFASSFSSEGSGERAAITSAGLAAIAQHPIAGVGPGNFRPGLFTPPDAPAQAREHPGKAHNQFVTIAAESGVLAALLLVVLLGLWLREGLRALPRGVAVVGAVAIFVLLALLHDPLFHAESSLALMLALGASLGFVRKGENAMNAPGGTP